MSARSGLVGKNPPGPIWGHLRPFFPWTGKIQKMSKFWQFSLVGQWALFSRCGPLLLSTRGGAIGISRHDSVHSSISGITGPRRLSRSGLSDIRYAADDIAEVLTGQNQQQGFSMQKNSYLGVREVWKQINGDVAATFTHPHTSEHT